ncbi:hypothetical protein MPER_09660 [Moniliophthora perniciosa FA553]|nr:hypothetical protein MPER_09660 [Moniliophthora perniciosa FA553]
MQRCYLKLLAALDWVEKYQPRMEGQILPHEGIAPVSQLMGAFVQDYKTASQLMRAGIPIWVVRERRHHRYIRVMEDAPVIVPSGYADFEPLESEPVYVGACGVDMIVARERYSCRSMAWGNPFGEITRSLTGTLVTAD